MFWSGNYIVVRELNFLLKEENVSLSQVLEAEDILQECKANNKALIQFLTRPEILAELVTLITEEPPQHVDLMSQYRHASIACEVLTSQLATLSDHLSMDTVQMHRLCDFINREPPLNPLLASYFSKTIEMLLERNPQQDWYQYHIVCLRVLDFIKSRKDFMPNLLRHLSTSAIADTFKYFIRVGDLCHKNVTEWLEENQFLECLIQIICGTYVPEPLGPPVAPTLLAARAEPTGAKAHGETEKAETEDNEKKPNHKDDDSSEDEIRVNNNISHNESDTTPSDTSNVETKTQHDKTAEDTNAENQSRRQEETRLSEEKIRKMQAVASSNATTLLCDIIVTGCALEGCTNRHTRTSYELVSWLCREETVRSLLSAVFTAPAPHAHTALLNGCRLLLALLQYAANNTTEGCEWQRGSVEVAIAPHLPLLHQALLKWDGTHKTAGSGEGESHECATSRRRVGAARLCALALLAHLAASEAQEVATTMITLGTPGAAVQLIFRYPDNNLLHAHALALLRNALDNTAYRTQFARHLLIECDLLTRLMDAFEENEAKKCSPSSPRAAYMGHVVMMLSSISLALHPAHYDLAERLPLPPALLARWRQFQDETLRPLLQRHDTPLGGSYPSENVYDLEENMDLPETAAYDFTDMQTAEIDDLEDLDEMCRMPAGGEAGAAPTDENPASENDEFKKMLSSSDKFGSDMWEDDLTDPEEVSRAVQELYCNVSPWDAADKSPNTAQETSSDVLAFAEACGAAGEAADGGGGEGEGEGEGAAGGCAHSAGGAGGWASFEAFCDPPVDPFTGDKVDTCRVDAAAWEAAERLDRADRTHWQQDSFSPFWDEDTLQEAPVTMQETNTKELEHNLMKMSLKPNQPLVESSIKLANNLLTAMSSMAPHDIANIVNANLPTAADSPMSGTTVSDIAASGTSMSENSESSMIEGSKSKTVITDDAQDIGASSKDKVKESISERGDKSDKSDDDKYVNEDAKTISTKDTIKQETDLTESAKETKTSIISIEENTSTAPTSTESSIKTSDSSIALSGSTSETTTTDTGTSESITSEASASSSSESVGTSTNIES